MSMYSNPVLDRSLWTSEELEIFDAFHGKCVVCWKEWAVTLHEICPKSKCPNTWQVSENRIPVCSRDHYRIHSHGATNSMVELAALRKERLKNV